MAPLRPIKIVRKRRKLDSELDEVVEDDQDHVQSEPMEIDSSLSNHQVNFNNLPFECLFLIFSRFPLQSLFPYRLVCSYWNLNIELFCHTKCNLKLILYLPLTKPRKDAQPKDSDLYYAPDMMKYCKDSRSWNGTHNGCPTYLEVNLANLNIQSITFLTESFRFVGCLTVVLNYRLTKSYDMSRVSNLLRLWSPNLRSFSLLIAKSLNNKPIHQRINFPLLVRLHEIISERVVDNFASLRQLHLCYGTFGMHFPVNTLRPKLNLPGNFLGQLEQLSLDCYTANLVGLLSQLGPKLTHLSLDCQLFPKGATQDRFFYLLSQVNPVLSHTVTHLRLFADMVESLPKFCSFFHGVRYLQLGCNQGVKKMTFSNISILPHISGTPFTSTWIHAIATLPHLTTLRLHRFELDLETTTASLPTVHTLIMHYPSIFIRTIYLKHFFTIFKSQFPALTTLSIVSLNQYRRVINLFNMLRGNDDCFPTLLHFEHYLIGGGNGV